MPRNIENFIQVQPLGGFDEPLTYSVGEVSKSSIKLGSLVKIPLGKRKVIGVVWSFDVNTPTDKFKVRKITSVIQFSPVITPELMKLASWISQYYSCTKESCLSAMIPAPIREGMKEKSIRLISIDKSNLDQNPIPAHATAQIKVINSLP